MLGIDTDFVNSLGSSLNFNTIQGKEAKLQTKLSVDVINAKLKAQRKIGSNKLGQDDFLKLLVSQLKHQDPLSPMKDRDFIAQMAQFSSLEQITKVNKSMENLIIKSSENSYYNLLGKNIKWVNSVTGKLHEGIVSSMAKRLGEFKIMVGDFTVDFKDIVKITG